MKGIVLVTTLLMMTIHANLMCQVQIVEFGIKAGLNYSQYRDASVFKRDLYEDKLGFYMGLFTSVKIYRKFGLQMELLIASQKYNYVIDDLRAQLPDGSFVMSDYLTTVNETILAVPVVVKFQVMDNLFVESGAQLGYIIKRREKVKPSPLDVLSIGSLLRDFKHADIGLALGAGYAFSKKIRFQARYILGLTNRAETHSSMVNFGILYYF